MSQKKQWSDYSSGEKRAVKIVLSILGAIILLVIASVVLSQNDQQDTGEDVGDSGSAEFTAKVLKQEVVDPATLKVYYQVENLGDVAAKPSCTINAQSANGTYRGVDVFSLGDLPAKEVDVFKSDLVITKEGAAYVTDVTVDCS